MLVSRALEALVAKIDRSVSRVAALLPPPSEERTAKEMGGVPCQEVTMVVSRFGWAPR